MIYFVNLYTGTSGFKTQAILPEFKPAEDNGVNCLTTGLRSVCRRTKVLFVCV